MLIDRDIRKYICFSDESIIVALKKISDNRSRTVFAVSERGVLEGVLTDGDFRRWVVEQRSIDLNQPLRAIARTSYRALPDSTPLDEIRASFGDGVDIIPLVDAENHVVAVASRELPQLTIAGRPIGDEHPVFIVAEMGINHNGDLGLAKQMIDAAADAGADCAKFQMRSLTTLYRNPDPNDVREDLGAQYALDLLTRFQLTPEEMFEAFDHCKDRGLVPLCTPWDEESVQRLEEYGVPAYKVASADMTNHQLLARLAQTGKPLFCSTGMSSESEIVQTAELLRSLGCQFVLLHCNSAYPAPFKDVNLNYLERLRQIARGPVGYSGHERGYAVALAAVAKGAKVIEKHFTFDRGMEGNDHKVSLLPGEFAEMVKGIRAIEESMGEASERSLSQGELMNRVALAKSLVATRDLEPGDVITEDAISVKSPGRGIQPNQRRALVGRVAKRQIPADDFFYPSDLTDARHEARAYRFRRPWGIPVRYHDFKTLIGRSNPGLAEFHLSYTDLDADHRLYIDGTYDLDLIVHSPELFRGDHLLDLTAEDAAYRRRSVDELSRVIERTREIGEHFPQAKRPRIIVNVGGFSKDAPRPKEQRTILYARVLESFGRLDTDGVELIPQTMPPFPWLFGGQRYHNIFLEAADTIAFCERNGYRLCLDVSHSKLSCNQLKTSFAEFIRCIGPYITHLHVGDASGVDGEGLQIGDGEIDFTALAEELDRVAPSASFIPETWQGHKNDGEGFWIALERLEGIF